MRKIISILLILTLALGAFAGCSNDGKPTITEPSGNAVSDNTIDNSGENSSADSPDVDSTKSDGDMFTGRDSKTEYDVNKAVTIRLNGISATASSNSVQISGPMVTIKEEATYVISGELTDGMLIVDAPDTAKLQIVFNGATIMSKSSAALYIREADKVFLTLADGTSNTLANGGDFTVVDDNNIDGALFSKQDLTLNGCGSLTVTSPAGHGIVCKDDLVIASGTYVVNAASHGLDANDSVRIANAMLTIDAGKDAIHCENSEDTSKGFIYISDGTIKAEAEGDGISASAYLQIADGKVDLLVGGGAENGAKESSDSFGGFMGGGRPDGMRPNTAQNNTIADEEDSTSMKGLKAAGDITISDGNLTINSADDSIHSDVSVIINGGTFTIVSGDDAIHAEDTLTIAAGKMTISECYEGLEALHIDVQGGEIDLTASDDGFNAAGGRDQSGREGGRDGMFGRDPESGHGGMSSNSDGSIQISGGMLYINASGDGIDANGTVEITGGHTTVVGPTRGDTATLDYDKSATISDGTFIGTGASGMAQTFSDSEQGVVAVSVGNQAAGTKIVLTDNCGNVMIEYTPELDFAVVILSSPDIKKGETYTITVGAESGEFDAS